MRDSKDGPCVCPRNDAGRFDMTVKIVEEANGCIRYFHREIDELKNRCLRLEAIVDALTTENRDF